MTTTRILFAIGLMIYQLGAYANEDNQYQGSHHIETKFAFGSIRNENLDLDSRYTELGYNYDLTNRWYVGVGLLRGDSDVLLSVNRLFNDTGFDFEAAKLKAGYKYRTSLKHQLYAEISLNRYTVKLSGSALADATFRDIGFGYSTGWRYLLSDRFSINIGLENHNFGDEFKIRSVVAGFAMSF